MIKNAHIVHFIDADGRYNCIKAVKPTPEKSTRDRKEVTCYNCRGRLGIKNREEAEVVVEEINKAYTDHKYQIRQIQDNIFSTYSFGLCFLSILILLVGVGLYVTLTQHMNESLYLAGVLCKETTQSTYLTTYHFTNTSGYVYVNSNEFIKCTNVEYMYSASYFNDYSKTKVTFTEVPADCKLYRRDVVCKYRR